MIRELLLLRHGKSDWMTGDDDYHRPLKDRGKRGAQRIGVWLQQQNLIPDFVITSPAERALITAQKCSKVMGIGAKHIHNDKRIYLADTHDLLATLANCPNDAHRVMLVGHNPGLELLLSYLADEQPEIPSDGKLMPTATIARLSMPDRWSDLSEGAGKLLQLIRPSSLQKKFPFPSPHSKERRDRPAYYYTQSSVIPYRISDGQLEVLIISSSKNKHWVIPKGIADPGHTLQESALKEAWEEAGVEGEVTEEAVGSYSYEKWGATCTVTVYPMAVTHQLPEGRWEERHRGRKWVSAKEAAALVKQSALGPMLMALNSRLGKE
ncbi:MAG: NUDIX domain-containing protein [Candidatus Sedimenticola sp. (ex Thyasira tokunagai)]